MSLMKTGCVNIEPIRGGFTTDPFNAVWADVHSAIRGRMQVRLHDDESVALVTRDRRYEVSACRSEIRTEEGYNGLAEDEWRICAQGENAKGIVAHMLPVFRLNSSGGMLDENACVWFAPQASLDRKASTISGLIQDIALLGRNAVWEGAFDLLDEWHGPETYKEPLGNEVDKLRYLYGEGVDPEYGEVAHLVLGFAYAVSKSEIFPPQDEVSLEQVLAAAEQAINYFDVQTVVQALVVGALDAAARVEGREGERAAKFRQRLQELMSSSRALANRAEGFEQLADDMFTVHPLSFVGAATFLMAAREHLEVARTIKFHGMRSQRLRAARIAFKAAQNRMEALRAESNGLKPVFMEYAQHQIGALGRSN